MPVNLPLLYGLLSLLDRLMTMRKIPLFPPIQMVEDETAQGATPWSP